MRATPIVMCCWPGLPRLWLCGDWFSLAIALGYGGILNLLLVSVSARPEWLPWPLPVLAWGAVGGFWIVSTARAYRQWPQLEKPSSGDNQSHDWGLFLEAQSEYLQGHWFEAETVLNKLVRHSHRDVEARLMLATLYRHTKRFDAAIKELDEINRLDGSTKWQSEIAAERRFLARGVMAKAA